MKGLKYMSNIKSIEIEIEKLYQEQVKINNEIYKLNLKKQEKYEKLYDILRKKDFLQQNSEDIIPD